MTAHGGLCHRVVAAPRARQERLVEEVGLCLADLFDCGQVAIFYRFSESISAFGHRYSSVTRCVQKGEKTSILIPIPKARRTIEPCQANLRPSGKFIRAYLIR